MRKGALRVLVLAVAVIMPAAVFVQGAQAAGNCTKCLGGFCLQDTDGQRICRVVKGKSTLKCKGGGKIDVGILNKGITVEGGCEFEGTQECEDIGSCAAGPSCDPTIMSCPPSTITRGFFSSF